MKPVSLCCSLALALAVALPARSQNRALQDRLEQAARVECTFPQMVTADWGDEGPTVTAAEASQEAAFFDIDVDSGTAEADSRFGASFIVVRYSFGYLHFMQMLNSGPLYVTTILAQETADGRLKATHTRLEYSPTILPGFTSRPEMYVGSCSVTGA